MKCIKYKHFYGIRKIQFKKNKFLTVRRATEKTYSNLD